VAKQMRKHGLPQPRTFGGRLDVEDATGAVSRWMRDEGALPGDFRDWDQIRGWAWGIASQLTTEQIARRAS
jgi:hypothetical protein